MLTIRGPRGSGSRAGGSDSLAHGGDSGSGFNFRCRRLLFRADNLNLIVCVVTFRVPVVPSVFCIQEALARIRW